MPRLSESLGQASSGLKERSRERCFLVIYGPYCKLRSLAFLALKLRTYGGPLGGALGQGDWYQSNNERIENMAASMLSQSKLFCVLPTSRLALSMLTLL